MWIQVLGPISVDIGSRVANLGGPKQRTVLALLALRANRSVGVEELINDVWEDDPPGRPRKTLQVYIANLRRELGDARASGVGARAERIASGAFGYRLTAGNDELDVRRHETLVTRARARASTQPATAISDYESALGLWTAGRPLADLLANAALTRLVRPLEEFRSEIVEELMSLRIQHGAAGSAIAALPDLIAADPWRERLWGLLMEAYYLTGRQVEALDTYQRVRTLMIDELGVEPGPELRNLERRILAQDPTLAAATTPAVQVEPVTADERTATFADERRTPTFVDERRIATFVGYALADYDRLLAELDPEDLAEVVDRFRARVVEIVAAHGGRVDATTDESVLVSFGYPTAAEDDAQQAVRAALAVCAGSGHEDVGDPVHSRACAGVHTGLALFRGTPATATGQAPGIAVRLQRAARPGEVLMSSATAGLVSAGFSLSPPGRPIALPSEIAAITVSGELPSAAGDLQPVVLAGRDPELARLRALDADDAPAVVAILGEAGIGKTALIGTFLAGLGSGGAVVVRGERHRRSQSLYPIGQLLVTRYADRGELELELDLLGVPRPTLDEVATVLSDLAGWRQTQDQPTPDQPPVLSVAARRSAVTTWLAALGSSRPLRLVAEDLPYLDAETLAVIDALVDEVNHGLVAVTTREEDLPLALAARAHRIELGRLDDDAARSLIISAAAPKRLRLSSVNELLRLAEGHPLHLRELARQAAAGPLSKRSSDVPMTLQGSLLARLDGLGADKALVQRCAVIGDQFDVDLAALVTDGIDAGDLPARLEALVAEGVFRRAGPADRPRYAFAQGLLEDVAYASLPRAVRTELHQRIAARLSPSAEAIARPTGLPPAAPQLAEHLEAAGQIPQAALGWVKAAEAALGATRFSEATTYARRALADLAQLPAGPQRDELTVAAKLLLATAIKMTVIADDELENTVLSAFALSDQAGLVELRVRFYPVLISTLQAVGRYDEAAKRGVEAVAIGRHSGNAVIERRMRQFHAATLIWMGRLAEARTVYEPVDSAGADTTHPLSPLLRAAEVLSDCAGLALAGLSELTCGRPEASAELFDRAIRRATSAAAPESVCLVTATQGIARQLAGDVEGAHRAAESTIELAVKLGNDWWFVWAQALLGWSVAADGNPSEGLALVLEAIEQAGDVRQLMPYFQTLAAEAELADGRPEDALRRLRDAAALAESTGERFFLPYIHVVTVSALAASDASEEEIVLHQGILTEVARQQGQRLFVDQVTGAY